MTTTAISATLDRTGHDKWLIYCPDIAPSTLLHLNIQGTSYALRDFTGTLIAAPHYSGDGQSFKAMDEHGAPITLTAEFRRKMSFEWHIDVLDLGIALANTRRWREFITRQNERLGIGQQATTSGVAGPVQLQSTGRSTKASCPMRFLEFAGDGSCGCN